MQKPFYLLPLLVFGGILISLLTTPLAAQNGVERIVIVNGGKFGDPTENVNVMLYDPVSGNSTVIDTIQTQSVQDILLEGSTAFVAAQDSIVKYDLNTGQRLAAAAFGSVSLGKLGVYEDYLLAGNWFGSGAGNLRIFDKNDLSFVDSIPQVINGVRDFVVVGDTAYLVQNFTNQFFGDSAGYISVIDLKRLRYVRDIPLDPRDELGRLVHIDGRLYGINPNVETIEVYDIATGQRLPKRFTGLDIQFGGVGTKLFVQDSLLYVGINNGIGVYDLPDNQIIDTTLIDTFATAFTLDTVNQRFYLTQTDFATYMRGGIYDAMGMKVGTLMPGFAPEAVGVVYNDLPVANDDGGFTPVNQSILLDVLQNDTDDGTLSIALGNMPQNGSFSIQNNQIEYIPDAGFSGFDRFTYIAMDGWGKMDTAEVQMQIGSTASPQEPGDFGLERVIFTTGGAFAAADNEVTAYSYNPETRDLHDFDKVFGDFSNAVLVEGCFSYVHYGRSDFNTYGKDLVIKYNMEDETAVDTALDVSGTNNILLYEDWMILTRAFGADSNYVLVFNKNLLNIGPIFVDEDIPAPIAGAALLGDKLYVSYNEADTARLGIFDLSNQLPFFEQSISLDTLAAPLGEIYTDGNRIIGLTEKASFAPPSFSKVVERAGVTIYDPIMNTWQTVATPTANSGLTIQGDSLFANFDDSGIGIFNLQSLSLDQNPIFPLNYSAAARDPRTGSFFFLQTNFFSIGLLGSSDSVGEFSYDIPTDISGQAMTLAYNHAPIANEDYWPAVGVPSMIPVSLNDQDPDGDSLRISIITPPQKGTASVVGDVILYNNIFIEEDFLVYAATDCWGRSDSATIIIGPIENIDEDLGLGEIQLYPVPAQDRLFISFQDIPFQHVQVEVFDLQGKKLIQSNFSGLDMIQLGVSHLPAGSYVLQLNYQEKVWTKRFIKE